MPIKNYTTSVSVNETVSLIHVMLAEHHAKRIMFEYDDSNRIESICFSISTPKGEQQIKLPANVAAVQAVLRQQKRDPKVKNKTAIDDSYEQAERVAWRIVKDWLSSQLALLETEMVTVHQVFLPYFMSRSGQTLYELVESRQLCLPE